MQIGTVGRTPPFVPRNNVTTTRDSDGGYTTHSVGSNYGLGKIEPPKVGEIVKKATAEQKAELRRKYDINNMEYGSVEHENLMSDLKDMGLISNWDYEYGQMPLMIPMDKVFLGDRLESEIPEWEKALHGNNLYENYKYSVIQHKENFYAKVSDKSIKDPMNDGLNDYAGMQSKTTIMNLLSEIFH